MTLTGFVSSFWEKDAAEKDAILVHAVKGVANDIEVRPFWQPTDPDIARHAIRKDHPVDPPLEEDLSMADLLAYVLVATRIAEIHAIFINKKCLQRKEGRKKYDCYETKKATADVYVEPVFTVDADFVLVTAAIPGVVTELEHRGLRIAWHPFTVNAQKPGSDLVIQFSTDECFQDFPAGAVPAEVLLPELLRDKLV